MEGNKKYKEKNPENKIRNQKNGPKSKLFLFRKAIKNASFRKIDVKMSTHISGSWRW
jgi:hypothetical protein